LAVLDAKAIVEQHDNSRAAVASFGKGSRECGLIVGEALVWIGLDIFADGGFDFRREKRMADKITDGSDRSVQLSP